MAPRKSTSNVEKTPEAKPKNKGGRPRKYKPKTEEAPSDFVPPALTLTLTDEIRAKIVQLVAGGANRKQSAASLGIPVERLKKWLHDGREYLKQEEFERPQAILAYQVEAAIAHYERRLSVTLESVLAQGVRATDLLAYTRWRLSISSPSEWSERALDAEQVTAGLDPEKVAAALASLKEKLANLLQAPSVELPAEGDQPQEETEPQAEAPGDTESEAEDGSA